MLDVEVMSQKSNQPMEERKEEVLKTNNKTETNGTKADGDEKVGKKKRVKLRVGIVGNSQSLAKKAFTHIIKMLSVMSKSEVQKEENPCVVHVPDYVVELYDVLNFSDNKTVIKQTMERLNLVIDFY